MCSRVTCLLVLMCIFWFNSAHASSIPDPEYCEVIPCDATSSMLMAPFGGGEEPAVTVFIVVVREGPELPVPNAYVEILFGHPGELLICDSDRLVGITDAQGRVRFNIPGGGCSISPNAVRICANHADIRVYDQVTSPDYDGAPDGAVALTDFTTFSAALVSGTGGCTDYFNDGTTGLDDFSAFGACWGKSCQ